MYTSDTNIDSRRRFADALRQTPGISSQNGHWTQELARVLAHGVAGHQSYKANEAEQENERLKTQEMAQLASVISGGAAPPLKAGEMPKFSHPDVEAEALAHALRTSQNQQQADLRNSNPTFGNSPIWGQDAQGNWVVMQSSDQGGIQQASTPDGVTLYPSAGLAGFDPNLISQKADAETVAEVENIQQTSTPAAQAAAEQATAVGDAETDIELDRQAKLYEQERAQELEEQRLSAFNRLSTQADQANNVLAISQTVLDQANAWTTGFMGSALSWAPGTPQHDLAKNLDTLKANAGFDKLQMMRDMSPTGGALGQVSELELQMLQATWASLSQSQSPEQFRTNVERFRDQVQRSWDNVVKAYEQDFGEPYYQSSPEIPGASMSNEPVEELTILQQADRILGIEH